jgi:hypothetical protein
VKTNWSCNDHNYASFPKRELRSATAVRVGFGKDFGKNGKSPFFYLNPRGFPNTAAPRVLGKPLMKK